MRTEEEITARLQAMEQAKAMWLNPPMVLHYGTPPPEQDIVWAPGQILPEGVEALLPNASLESLNAEIAALTWTLGTTLSEQEAG